MKRAIATHRVNRDVGHRGVRAGTGGDASVEPSWKRSKKSLDGEVGVGKTRSRGLECGSLMLF